MFSSVWDNTSELGQAAQVTSGESAVGKKQKTLDGRICLQQGFVGKVMTSLENSSRIILDQEVLCLPSCRDLLEGRSSKKIGLRIGNATGFSQRRLQQLSSISSEKLPSSGDAKPILQISVRVENQERPPKVEGALDFFEGALVKKISAQNPSDAEFLEVCFGSPGTSRISLQKRYHPKLALALPYQRFVSRDASN